MSKSNWTAETWAAHWLAEANSASERGDTKREEMYLSKAQYWLDRANRAREKS